MQTSESTRLFSFVFCVKRNVIKKPKIFWRFLSWRKQQKLSMVSMNTLSYHAFFLKCTFILCLSSMEYVRSLFECFLKLISTPIFFSIFGFTCFYQVKQDDISGSHDIWDAWNFIIFWVKSRLCFGNTTWIENPTKRL